MSVSARLLRQLQDGLHELLGGALGGGDGVAHLCDRSVLRAERWKPNAVRTKQQPPFVSACE